MPNENASDKAEIEARLRSGEWLSPPQIAPLFGRERGTVNRWIRKGKLGHRKTPGGHFECDPADVLALLKEWQTVKRGEGP